MSWVCESCGTCNPDENTVCFVCDTKQTKKRKKEKRKSRAATESYAQNEPTPSESSLAPDTPSYTPPSGSSPRVSSPSTPPSTPSGGAGASSPRVRTPKVKDPKDKKAQEELLGTATLFAIMMIVVFFLVRDNSLPSSICSWTLGLGCGVGIFAWLWWLSGKLEHFGLFLLYVILPQILNMILLIILKEDYRTICYIIQAFAAIGGILLVYWAMKNEEKLFIIIISWIVAILTAVMFAIIPLVSTLF